MTDEKPDLSPEQETALDWEVWVPVKWATARKKRHVLDEEIAAAMEARRTAK